MSSKTVKQVLVEAASLLADVNRWTRGRPAAIDLTGAECEPCDPDAVAWCVDGALQKSGPAGALYLDAEKALLASLGGTWTNITDWENWPARRHSEVVGLFARAIEGLN